MRLYILVRIPKSGSRSLVEMVKSGLRGSNLFHLPSLSTKTGPDMLHNFRVRRNRLQGYMRFGAISEKGMWRKIAGKAVTGDIVAAHMEYGAPQLPECDLRYVTLLRDPVSMLISGYHYNRQNYLNLPAYRKLYRRGLHSVVGTSTLSEYIRFLYENIEERKNPATRFVTGDRSHNDPFIFLKDNYFHFGVLDQIDLFASQFADKIGTTINVAWENKTNSEDFYRLTDTDRQCISEIFEKDIELYHKAKDHILSTSAP